MKTKAQIIQELLEKKAISVEDAMVLMMADERTIIYQSVPYYPQYPISPLPYYLSPPFEVTCQN